MPRVSEAHLAARRQQILDAARVCFARDGFHNTSMQDVIKEAGLSVGAFYRYFKSKEELIGAIASQVVGLVTETVAEVVTHDPPLPTDEVYVVILEALERELHRDGLFPLAIQVWAESLRNPELAVSVAFIYRGLRGLFVDLATRQQRAGRLPAEADPEAVGAVMFALIPGYALQRVLLGDPDREAFLAGLQALLPSRDPAAR